MRSPENMVSHSYCESWLVYIQVAKEATAGLRRTNNTCTHCWYQRDVERRKLRRALVRGHLSDREVEVVRSQMHEQAKGTLGWLRRKTAGCREDARS